MGAESCTILTTEASEVMKPVNNTMPVILDSSSDGVWLDLNSSADLLRSLCASFASVRMKVIAVRRCGTLFACVYSLNSAQNIG